MVGLGAPSSMRMRALLSRGIAVALRTDRPVTMTVRLVVHRADARRLKLGTKDVTVGTARASVGTSGRTVRVRVAARWRKRLGAARRVVLALRVSGAGASGVSTAARSVTVRR